MKQSAEYKGTDGSLTYRQVFDFDRFGNMYRKAANNPSTGQANPLPYTQIEESDISKATNRFTTGTTYDEAGEVVSDAKFRGMGFGYDANGRMVKATKANVPDALSVYDAAGMRVAERVNDVWRFSVYDIGGKIVAEYGGPTATDEGGVKYLLSDWQGSNRAVVSNTGNVRARVDYTAFGENIRAGTGLRTTAQGFDSTINPRQQYGLTERDSATGLDHTWFRKNEGRAGRWTSPDPYLGSMSVFEPQSFNRFSYVANQPTNFIDPSGLMMEVQCSVGYEWRPHIEGGGDWILVQSCYLVDDGLGGNHGPPIIDDEVNNDPNIVTKNCTNSGNCSYNSHAECVKAEKKNCYEEGRKHFDANVAAEAGKGALWFQGTGSSIYGILKSMGYRQIAKFIASKLGGPYIAVIGMVWGVYNLTQAAKKIEAECNKNVEEKCAKCKGR